MRRVPDNRVNLTHHMILCTCAGFVIGIAQTMIMHGQRPLQILAVACAWILLGAVHGPLLWPVLHLKAWWTTSVVLSAALVGAGVAGIAPLFFSIASGAVAVPLVFLWLAAAFCRRRLPNVAVPGTCRVCGYDLRGLPEPRCPECGTSQPTAG